jgi:uncharacterized membrane protein
MPLNLPFSPGMIKDTLTSATAFVLLFLYHVHLIRQVRRNPLQTAVGITNHVRETWVCSVMQGERDILAVQTLRNNLMAANFLASTAILISLGLLSVVFKPGFFENISHSLNLLGTRNPTLWMIKLMVLTVLFFFAFFNFTLAIRYFNHAGFMLTIAAEHDPTATPQTVASVLNHAALHYTMGMRGFYLAVPVGLWLFGPVWMLAAAIILIWVLWRLDRTA